MNKNKTRFIAALLALMTLSTTAMAACAEQDDGDSVVTGDVQTGTETFDEDDSNFMSADQRKKIADNLPEFNGDGMTYDILINGESSEMIDVVEEQEGDVVEDAAFRRNSAVMERFNIEIAINDQYGHRDVGAALERFVASDDDTFEIYAGHAIVAGGNAVNGMFMNWHDIDYTDFEKPWWSQNSVDALTLNGKMFLVPTYFTISTVGNTYCMYYNKTIAANYNLDNIYDIVNNNQWTLEKMRATVTDVYNDLNGNNRQDADDAYGLATTALSPAVTYTWAFDMDVLEIDEDYGYEITVTSERNATIYQDVFDLYYRTTGVTTSGDNHGYAIDVFRKGNTLMSNGLFNQSLAYLRDFEDPYAIIPYPMYDEEQGEYFSMLDGGHTIIGVPITCTDTEFTGLITEALAAESWKEVIPAYYEMALKTKGVRDEESIAMMDKITQSVKVDFVYIYDNWQGYAFFMQTLLQPKNENFSSALKKTERPANKWYQKMMDAFLDID